MEVFDMELIKRLIDEYLISSKKSKSKIIDKYMKLTKVNNRKTVIKRFNRYIYYTKNEKNNLLSKRGRLKKYNSIHKQIIKLIFELCDYSCAENIHPQIKEYINQLKNNDKLINFKDEDIEIVQNISLGSLKRIISQLPKPRHKKHKGQSEISKNISIYANFGENAYKSPGYIEIDFVEHKGGYSDGRFALSACYLDIYSQWISRASAFGKDLESIKQMDEIALSKIYHPIIHYHVDNDRSLLSYLFNKLQVQKNNNFELSRSRPYKKNDNAHVEQKNGDKIRKLVGYFRYDREEYVYLLNELYYYADLYDNFFKCSCKLIRKEYNNKGMIIRRIDDKAKTPYQRLMESEISEATKSKLTEIYNNLNMVKLKEEIDKRIDELNMLVIERNSENVKRFGRHKFLSNKNNKKRFGRHLILI